MCMCGCMYFVYNITTRCVPPSVEPGGVSDMRLGQSERLAGWCSSQTQSDQ